MKALKIILLGLMLSSTNALYSQAPKIVNIVNFVRLLEPRDPNITEDVLFQTVLSQVDLMRKHNLKGTFLLQYDALMDPRYQDLFRSLPRDSFEVGAWWEIPQPLVENSGLKWRGRYPWDWRANIGFSTGYTQQERKVLIDTYMTDFFKIFGYYPKSVASWFIDAYSLNYMYEKYHIVASANCKDQFGTDGYTLWGGYWNQAYYPSKRNVYMPAQHRKQQIPVPIFRMLGSDPIRQYDTGIGHDRQGVITLEPVYPNAGGDSVWVNWYLEQFVTGASMAFAYTQAGQENSFTWNAMKDGLKLQFPIIERLKDNGEIRVETLKESGRWFKEHFKLTPATSVTALKDLPGGNKKTVWFNSRFYRANLLWDKGTLKFRDIHLFDENVVSPYYSKPAETNECQLVTLPFLDGYLWSNDEALAGLEFKLVSNRNETLLEGGNPLVNDDRKDVLEVDWSLTNVAGRLQIKFTEKQVEIKLLHEGVRSIDSIPWFLDFKAAEAIDLPIKEVDLKKVTLNFNGIAYYVKMGNGYFKENEKGVLRIIPEKDKILLKLAN